MTRPSEDDTRPADTPAADGETPAKEDGGLPWVGHWKVLRWDGQSPAVPTYYVASPARWDVVKIVDGSPSAAPHPILEAGRETLVLKDEGADDTDRERWRVEASGEQLIVTALTGPHEGAVGVAERTPIDPYEALGEPPSDEHA